MKKIYYCVIVFSLLLTTCSGFTQYDQYKPRTIIHYDNIVNIPKPVNDPAGTWWNFFIIGVGVTNYMGSVDSSRDCLILFDMAYFQSDSMSSSIGIDSSTINAPPSDSIPGSIDYIIYGQVDGSNGNYTYTLNLEVQKTREVVKSVQVQFHDGFNPIQIGSQAVSQIGPVIYNTILDFEKKKRDQDEGVLKAVIKKIGYTYPHAVSPIVIIQPAKTEVKPGETIGVVVVAVDYDSHPLKGRTITLEAVNGTLKATTLTTDADGGAATEFTAAGVSGLATISGVLEYMTGTEYKGKADCQPAAINIDRPNDTYVVHATYTKYSIDHPDYDLLISGSFTRSANYNWTTIYIDAWVKNVAGPYEIFRSSDPIIEQCKANQHIINSEREYINAGVAMSDTKTWEIQDGTYSEEGYYLLLTVDDIGYNWHISQIPLNMTTSVTVSTTITYHPDPLGLSSSKVTSNNSNGSTTTAITTMGGAKRDTSYTNITTTTDILGGTDKDTKTLKKTFVLNDSSGYTTTWSNHYFTNNELDNVKLGSVTHLTNDLIEKATVTLNNSNPTAVSILRPVARSFALQQNYPNPFNPSTNISFNLPTKLFVSLKVFDLIGREVATILDKELSGGGHSIQWNASNFASGVYFYRLQAGGNIQTKKLILLR